MVSSMNVVTLCNSFFSQLTAFGGLLYVFWMFRCFLVFWSTVSFLVSFRFYVCFSFAFISILQSLLLILLFHLILFWFIFDSFDWFVWFNFGLIWFDFILLECFKVKDWSFGCSDGFSPIRFVFWLLRR